MNQPTMLTYSDLAARWNRDVKTIRRMVADKKIKVNKVTNMFSLTHIEAIEQADNDIETVSALKQKALQRENERLREENAVLKGTLYQVAVTAKYRAILLVKKG